MLAYGFAWTLSRAMNQLCMIPINRVIERGMRLLGFVAKALVINARIYFGRAYAARS